MNQLSVDIITLNEALNIEKCIQSVQAIADEIIVVDSGSVDDTVKIATALGAKVQHHDFEGYTQQKNFAFTQCSYDYVLSLDADEVLSDECKDEIQQLKKTGFLHDGYGFKRLNYIGNKLVKYGVWGNDIQLRLVKKDQAIWDGKGVHEKLIINSTNIFTLKGTIHHYSYKNSDELFEKTHKYALLAARYLYTKGVKISPLMVYIKATSRFIKHWILKAGFLDGKEGWQIAHQQYMEAYWKYSTLRWLHSTNK